MLYKGTHTLPNLYDSHVHWYYTGQVASTWNLKKYTDPDQILKAHIKLEYFRGDWLTAFGWDENNWNSEFKIHRYFLDQKFLNIPVHFSRTDGHSSWVNTKALNLLGFFDTRSDHFKKYAKDIVLDDAGIPTGYLKESAHMYALFSLPEVNDGLQKSFLLRGAEIFNQAGFTHIRDMTSNPKQWKLNLELLSESDFLLHTEHWFVCEEFANLQQTIQQIQDCQKNENNWMKIRGVKVFADGSLGSQTACLSKHYEGSTQSGQIIWSEVDVKNMMREVWKNKIEIAFHAIGDQTSHQIIQWAREVYSEGVQGRIHLEHAQILRPETIQNMKSLHVRCHLQPCHWWSDQKWLKKRLGVLFDYVFPWEALRKAQIPFSFGSDSPIESSSFFSNLKALDDSAIKGIKKLGGNPEKFHLYPAQDSVEGWTQIVDDTVHSIYLGSKKRFFT